MIFIQLNSKQKISTKSFPKFHLLVCHLILLYVALVLKQLTDSNLTKSQLKNRLDASTSPYQLQKSRNQKIIVPSIIRPKRSQNLQTVEYAVEDISRSHEDHIVNLCIK